MTLEERDKINTAIGMLRALEYTVNSGDAAEAIVEAEDLLRNFVEAQNERTT